MLGVGGMGMTPLALYMQQAGWHVSGQDDALQEPSHHWLEQAGVALPQGEPDWQEYDLVVYSSAIAGKDARLQKAQESGIRTLRRGEMLAELSKETFFIAIVGSHGKTTTCSMLIHALRKMEQPFSYVLGGLFRGDEIPPAHYESDAGKQNWLIAEVDESDGTIAHFSPDVTVAVNLDWDHPDQYQAESELDEAFGALFERTTHTVFMPTNCERLDKLAARARCDVVKYGAGSAYEGILDWARSGLVLHGEFPNICLSLPMPSAFNAHNALAALAVIQHLSGHLREELFSGYPGIRRRQDELYRHDSVAIFADYAHHPTEIEALLAFARARGEGRQVVVFQPHRYTRTKHYAGAFARVLSHADAVCLLPVYAASEAPIPGGSSEAIASEWAEDGPSLYQVDSYDAVKRMILENLDEQSVVLFVGAGDIEHIARRFAQEAPDLFEKGQAAAATTAGDWVSRVRKELSPETKLFSDYSLARKTTIRVGGAARYFAEPASLHDLQILMQYAHEGGLPVFFLGRGSNLIVHESGYDGLVIHLGHSHWRSLEAIDNERLKVGAGVRLQALSARACKLGLAGFEFLEGIPGSVGGALRMNAGAMGGWMFDVVESVTYLTSGGELRELPREAFHVGYRFCDELREGIALSAVLKAPELSNSDSIRETMNRFSRHRIESQPREPSAGCIFKNPEGGHAGMLIDQSGLKGKAVGNAEVSAIHANFIINRGGATSSDVIELVRQVRGYVYEKSEVLLQPEVMLVGQQWEEVL